MYRIAPGSVPIYGRHALRKANVFGLPGIGRKQISVFQNRFFFLVRISVIPEIRNLLS